VLNEDDPNTAAKVFVFRAGDIGDAAQQMAYTTAPSQIPWAAHVGDLVTSLGLILVGGAEVTARVIEK
jgi:hypothetical protein